jgi:hypothetical protein
VCDARRRADAAIGVHHITDSELGVYFVQGLEDVDRSRAAPILSGEANAETRFLEVAMALQNLAGWKIRPQVYQVANHVEGEHDVTVLCHFRPLDPVPFAPRPARLSSAPARLTLSPSTSPSHPFAFGLGDAGVQVVADLFQPGSLRGICP